eukprot:UN12064
MEQFHITVNGSIDYDKCLISRICHEEDKDDERQKVYCVSQIGWNRGIHEFKIKCIELSDRSNAIGIVSNKEGFLHFEATVTDWAHDWSFDSEQAGVTYQIYFRNNLINYDGIYSHINGTQEYNKKIGINWEQNDIIHLNIDCNAWELTVYINDKLVGECKLAKNIKYYPAGAFGGTNDA